MKYTIENCAEDFHYPDEDEIRKAVKICCGRCCHACETPVEYAWRKRNIDLAELLDVAIERELSDREKEFIKDMYFSGRTAKEIASENSITVSAVYATLSLAEKKLKRVLDYVVMYQNDSISPADADSRICEAFTISVCSAKDGDSIGEKIRNHRCCRGISLAQAEKATGISKSAFSRIENGTRLPDSDEIIKICTLLHIDAGELLNCENKKNKKNQEEK